METKKMILILLTIFIIGPLVFVGTCYPIGFLTYASTNGLGIILAIIIGLILALWAVTAITKRITRK